MPRKVAVIAAVASLSMTGCGNKSPEERTAADRSASTVPGNTVDGSLNLDPNTVFVTPGEFKFVNGVSGVVAVRRPYMKVIQKLTRVGVMIHQIFIRRLKRYREGM